MLNPIPAWLLRVKTAFARAIGPLLWGEESRLAYRGNLDIPADPGRSPEEIDAGRKKPPNGSAWRMWRIHR